MNVFLWCLYIKHNAVATATLNGIESAVDCTQWSKKNFSLLYIVLNKIWWQKIKINQFTVILLIENEYYGKPNATFFFRNYLTTGGDKRIFSREPVRCDGRLTVNGHINLDWKYFKHNKYS